MHATEDEYPYRKDIRPPHSPVPIPDTPKVGGGDNATRGLHSLKYNNNNNNNDNNNNDNNNNSMHKQVIIVIMIISNNDNNIG